MNGHLINQIERFSKAKFHKLSPVLPVSKDKTGRTIWLFQCDCGRTKCLVGSTVACGQRMSCGCLLGRDENIVTYKSEYQTFLAAKQRCNNPNNRDYRDYGGRGIKFLFDSFEDFFNTVGPRPPGGFSLDRINNYGHYSPENVRWANTQTQLYNRRPHFAIENFSDEEVIAEVKRRGLKI